MGDAVGVVVRAGSIAIGCYGGPLGCAGGAVVGGCVGNWLSESIPAIAYNEEEQPGFSACVGGATLGLFD